MKEYNTHVVFNILENNVLKELKYWADKTEHLSLEDCDTISALLNLRVKICRIKQEDINC